jgi:hypothetical protein
MGKKPAVVVAFSAAVFAAAPAQALDSVSFESGRGNDKTDMWRVGWQWESSKKWLARGNWYVGAYWDLQLGSWINNQGKAIVDVGLTPVFRLQQATASAWSPYMEAAIGFHSISDTHVDSRRVFSTHFQFGDHLGAGVRFGDGGRYDTSVRLQHLSNGGLEHPNPGINYVQLRVQYHFP